MTKLRECPVCQGVLPPSRTRPRLYCGHNCRQYAWNLERRAKTAAAVIAEWERLQQAKRG